MILSQSLFVKQLTALSAQAASEGGRKTVSAKDLGAWHEGMN